jgi:hypothetical protein
MKKLLTHSFLAGITIAVLTGCSGSQPQVKDGSLSDNAIYTKIHDHQKLKKIIKEAAKKDGWRVTEFKENALVAEKFDDDEPKETTIKFVQGHVDFDNAEGTTNDDIDDLRENIEDLAEDAEETH